MLKKLTAIAATLAAITAAAPATAQQKMANLPQVAQTAPRTITVPPNYGAAAAKPVIPTSPAIPAQMSHAECNDALAADNWVKWGKCPTSLKLIIARDQCRNGNLFRDTNQAQVEHYISRLSTNHFKTMDCGEIETVVAAWAQTQLRQPAPAAVPPAYQRDARNRYGAPRYDADRVLDSLGPNGRVMHRIKSPRELDEQIRTCGRITTVRGVRGFLVDQDCLAAKGLR